MQIFKSPNFNFVRWRWHAIALSLVVIILGLVMVSQRGLPLGVEFEGGTIVILKFDQMPELERVRSALAAGMPGGENAIVQTYGDAADREVMIRVSQVGAESGGELSRTADMVIETIKKANLGNFSDEGREVVGPVVGDQLKRQGTLATVLALAGILVYIALRFQFSFALGAVAATVHDLLITLGFLVFFDYDITLNVIAAILTITG
jgi:preprotein translocase subunit SecF